MKILTISGIKCPVLIGVFEFEQEQPTVLTVDISVSYELEDVASEGKPASAQKDEVASVLNYDDIIDAVKSVQKHQPFQLVETVLDYLEETVKITCQTCKPPHYSLHQLEISITKPYPSVPKSALAGAGELNASREAKSVTITSSSLF